MCVDFAFKVKISLLVAKLFGVEQNKHLLLFGFFCCSYFCSNVLTPLKVCNINRWKCNHGCLGLGFFF